MERGNISRNLGVLGGEGHEELEDEALGAGAVLAAADEGAEQAVHELGGFALFVAREVGLDEGDEIRE